MKSFGHKINYCHLERKKIITVPSTDPASVKLTGEEISGKNKEP